MLNEKAIEELVEDIAEDIHQLSESSCPLCVAPDYPVCGEKRGYGEVKPEDAEEWVIDHEKACPVNKIDKLLALLRQPPPAGKFTKECRKYISWSPVMSQGECKGYAERLSIACARLDAEQEKKDLLADLDAECRVSQMLLVGQGKLQAKNKDLEAELAEAWKEIERLKGETVSSMQRELANQCIKFTKQSDGGFANIPLGYNLNEDIGLITQAEQALTEKGTDDKT